jgi:hypothetical protein
MISAVAPYRGPAGDHVAAWPRLAVGALAERQHPGFQNEPNWDNSSNLNTLPAFSVGRGRKTRPPPTVTAR